jgi:hypothetical protein
MKNIPDRNDQRISAGEKLGVWGARDFAKDAE